MNTIKPQKSSIDISVIIVSWNSWALTQKSLDSILRSKHNLILPHRLSSDRHFTNNTPNSFHPNNKVLVVEVLVIDNGSNDITNDLTKEYPQVGFMLLNANHGFGVSSNLGAINSRGEYLFFLNPDIQLEPDSLMLLHQEAKTIKGVGILSPVLLNDDYTPAELPIRYPDLLSVISDLPVLNNIIPEKKKKTYSLFDNISMPTETDWVLGAAMLMPRKLFNQVGGFDRDYFLFSEDIDLCLRVKKLNYKIFYSPVTKIIHSGGATTRKVGYVRETILWESTFLFFKKHKGIIYSTLSRIFVFLAYFLELVRYLIRFLKHNSPDYKDRIKICIMALVTCLGFPIARPSSPSGNFK